MNRQLVSLCFGGVGLVLLCAAAGDSFAQGGPPPRDTNPPLFKGDKKGKGGDETVRSLHGLVVNAAEQPIEGAVVKLKDAKTLRVRSFITQSDGQYRFHGLSTNVDYQIWADHGETTSDQRSLSVFDSRRDAVINLKLDKKREQKD
jgi:hypothetical protein